MNPAEKLYMLRLWQEDNKGWHASLKPVGKGESAAQYFHSLESLTKFLGNRNFLDTKPNKSE